MPRPSLRLPALLGIALLAGACASAPRAADPASLPQAPAWTPATPPAEVAAWAQRECRGRGDARSRCVERTLYAALERSGLAAAMAALDTLTARDAGLRGDGHGLAHGLGIAAYRSPETLGATFAACPPTQMSGCYHGVIQGHFLALKRDGRQVSAQTLDAVCAEQRARSLFLYFQCTHGLGHGVMALAAHHLPRALALCDQVTAAAERENCYGGAFMENVVAVTHPHHTAEAHAATGGAAGHGQGAHAAHGTQASHAAGGHEHAGHATPQEHAGHGAADAMPWKPADPADAHYPCSVVAERYRPGCYDNQPGLLLTRYRGDVAAVARDCAAAPGGNARVCFLALGRNILAQAGQRPEAALRRCTALPEPGAGWCAEGVTRMVVNLAGDAGAGLRACALRQGQATRTACYWTVGSMLRSLEGDPARRERLCAAADPAFAEACRRGARGAPLETPGAPATPQG